jgi:hypothetical protein
MATRDDGPFWWEWIIPVSLVEFLLNAVVGTLE